MSSPAAAPPHLPQKHGPGRSLEGLPEIIAFMIVAAVLVVGPKIWTLGEVLASLGRSITGTRAVEVAPLSRAKQRPMTKTAPVPAVPAQPRLAKPRSRPTTVSPARPSVRASPPSSAAETNAARLQHYHALMDQGVRLYRSGWYGPSVGRFREAATTMPTSPYAFLWLGRANLAAGRPAAAREALQRVIVLAPDSQAAREASALLQQLAASNI